MSYSEYLALEEGGDPRHEFLNGEVFAMAGGTPEHGDLESLQVSLSVDAVYANPLEGDVSQTRV